MGGTWDAAGHGPQPGKCMSCSVVCQACGDSAGWRLRLSGQGDGKQDGEEWVLLLSMHYWINLPWFLTVFTNCLHTFSKLSLLFSKLYRQFSKLHTQNAKCLTSPHLSSKCHKHVRMKHLHQMANISFIIHFWIYHVNTAVLNLKLFGLS